MPGDSFHPIPWGGKPSRRWYERVQEGIEAGTSGFESMPMPGTGFNDLHGATFLTNTLEWVWANITELPDETHTGYSWQQMRPTAIGEFEVEPQPITGTNGVTTTPRYHVLYSESTLAVDDIVQAYLSYVDPDEGPCWQAVVGGGTSTTTEICQPMHAGVADDVGDLELHYPSVFVRRDTAAGDWTEGPFMDGDYDCYLIQAGRQTSGGYPLTVTSDDGPGRYLAVKQVGSKTLTVDSVATTLPVYATTDRPTLGPDCTVQN